MIYPSSLSRHIKWEDYKPLLSKLKSLIPQPLTFSTLADLDPQLDTTQSSLAVFYEELCVHNSAIIHLHTSLNNLFTFLQGDTLFTSKTGEILASIRENVVPLAWKSFLLSPLAHSSGLMSALSLLKHRIEFYTEMLERGKLDMPLVVDLFLLSNPEDMISRILHISPTCDSSRKASIDAKVF